jgi:hypothetical protein
MVPNHNAATIRAPLNAPLEEALEAIRSALGTIRYGAIALTVHDARIVQIEVTEKRRFLP